jgi:hypothetical protein
MKNEHEAENTSRWPRAFSLKPHSSFCLLQHGCCRWRGLPQRKGATRRHYTLTGFGS